MSNFRRVFGNLTSPVPLSYLDDNFGSLETASTSTVSLSGAALINYTQLGASAVSRTVQARLQEVISVKDFGATGDGSTDDYAAVQAAITAAAGGILYFPEGVYRVNTALTGVSSIVMQGSGAGSVIQSDVASAAFITFTSKTDVTWRDLKFTSRGTYSPVITFALCNRVRIENCIFDSQLTGPALASISVRSQGSTNLDFVGCKFYDADTMIYLEDSGGTQSDLVNVLDCYFEHTFVGNSDNPTGIYQFNCNNVLVDDCTFKNIVAGGGTPIAGYSVYEGDGTAVSLVVTNCISVVTTAKAHVMVQNSNAPYCRVEGNRFYGTALGAGGLTNFLYNGGSVLGRVHVLNNYSQQGGFSILGGGTAANSLRIANVHGNIINKLEQNTAGIRIGVSTSYFVDYASVKDNTVYCSYGGSIQISECVYREVIGNKCLNWNTLNNGTPTNYAYTAAIYDLSATKTGVINNNKIENNTRVGGDTGFPQYGIVLDASSTTVVVDNNDIGVMLVAKYVNSTPYTENLTAWTASVGGDATYTARDAYYVKKGNEVSGWFDVTINVLGTGSASDISGLPYATALVESGVTIGFFSGLAVSPVMLKGYITGSSIRLVGLTAGAASITNPLNALGNGARVMGAFSYAVSS